MQIQMNSKQMMMNGRMMIHKRAKVIIKIKVLRDKDNKIIVSSNMDPMCGLIPTL